LGATSDMYTQSATAEIATAPPMMTRPHMSCGSAGRGVLVPGMDGQ
jgi:hypothetical protein